MAGIKIKPSPCEGCPTVRDPDNCQNKNCTRYQNWFMEQWDYFAQLIYQKLKEKEGANGQKT